MEEKFNKSRFADYGWSGLLAGSGFCLLAGWFLFGSDLLDIPEARGVAVHKAHISTAPLRRPLEDPPVILVGGFQYTCMDCHKLFPPRENPPDQLLQHRHVVVNHGINDQCRNCHDVFNRDRLVLQSGDSIPYTGVVKLCSNCHGPTFRDWERGMHGRTNGYWDKTRGEQHRLGCTECHDPHSPRIPAMQAITPLPPPNTLRMERPAEHEAAVERDPLRQVLIQDAKTRKQAEPEEEF